MKKAKITAYIDAALFEEIEALARSQARPENPGR